MKEASGELSMTAITVVAIAAIGGIFTAIIYPTIKNNIVRQAACSNKFNCTCTGNTCNCSYYDKNGDIKPISCPYDGDVDISPKGNETKK